MECIDPRWTRVHRNHHGGAARLPAISEVSATFPAVVAWKFRVAAIGMQVIMWTTIGLSFGVWVERSELGDARA
jgi:predicted cobalt transporter CbtA